MSERTDRLGDRFDPAAARHPDLPAVVAGGVAMSYRQLDDAAGRVAARLSAVAGPGARVGVVADRTVHAYAAYLGVLRAGATVVPVNPAFPVRRTGQMLRRAAVRALAGAPAELDRLGPGRSAGPVGTGDWRLDLAAGPAEGPPDAPAYVLFTSGSTGVPKGIPISHRNVTAFLRAAPDRGIEPGERVGQCYDLTFDPSVHDMFGTWAAGGTLVVPGADQLRDPVAFAAAAGLAHWSSVPSVVSLAARMRQLRPGVLPALRTSWFAGEALTLRQARAWRAAAPQARIGNAYGPTELTVTCTAYALPADPADWPETRNGTVPIGRPYRGVRWRVAAAGELWLAGPQRFAGYLDPADDAGRFDPPGRPGPDSWFRTGDSVAETPDGLLHLGRLDQQVQVNGYRVELSEVEGALRSHPAVQDAVAFLRDGELVAVHTGPAADAGPILDAVGRRLPRYMVPSRLFHEPELPLNANGKIDRTLVAAGLGVR